VRAGAPAGGDGSPSRPLASLAAVEAASRPGDRIVVEPADRPLDGGILLQPGQRLQGAGPPVVRRAEHAAAPTLTNTTRRLDGDAVRLADRAVVRNLRIRGTRRGGVFGRDVTRVTITGNDIAGHNRSCAPGFHIPPFQVPTLVTGLGIPISHGLQNGWAGIMLDATRGSAKVGVHRNRVHDARCGDGIDVRALGPAALSARIGGNEVHDLAQGPELTSVLAIGLQARDGGRLEAELDDNRQHALGGADDVPLLVGGADYEGLFVNVADRGRAAVRVTRNRFDGARGRGGFSANGLELVSMGDGAAADLDVRDSTFVGSTGDVLEQLALGTNGTLRMRLERVVARDSTGHLGSGFGDTVVIPGNNADCVIAASGGAGNVVDLDVRDSAFTGCANNGLTFGSSVANGTGATRSMRLDVRGTRIAGNHGGNLRIGHLSDIGDVAVRVADSDLSGSRGNGSSPANLVVEHLAAVRRSRIDLGGGPLGSPGGNCLHAGLAALIVGAEVDAAGNWWGDPAGPALGRALSLGVLRAGAPLARRPRCG
jgi:hypothetical protein